LVSLIGHARLKQWLDLEPDVLAPRIADDAIPDQLRAVVKVRCWTCSRSSPRSPTPRWQASGATSARAATSASGTLATLAASKLPGQRERLRRLLGERVLRVTVKPFMDMNTMIEARLTQCCVHVATVNGATGDHQCAPFCAVQAWTPLSQSRISTSVACRLSPLRAHERSPAGAGAAHRPLG